VNGVRCELFACAALAFDKHVGRGGRDLFDRFEHLMQRRGIAPDIFETVSFVHLLPQRAIFLLKLSALHCARDQYFRPCPDWSGLVTKIVRRRVSSLRLPHRPSRTLSS